MKIIGNCYQYIVRRSPSQFEITETMFRILITTLLAVGCVVFAGCLLYNFIKRYSSSNDA